LSRQLPYAVRLAAQGTLVLAIPLAAVALWGTISGGTIATTSTLLLLNVVLAVALQSFSGNSGTVSFAPMLFAAIGAYTAGLLAMPAALKGYFEGMPGWLAQTSVGLLPAVLAGTVTAGLAGALTAVVGARLSGAPAVVATLALLLMGNVVLIGWTDVTHGAGGLAPLPRLTTVSVALGGAIVAIAVSLGFRFSRWGIQLRASQTDATAALASGVKVGLVRAAAWLVQALLAGLGGALFALHLGAVTPSMFFLSATFTLLAMVIVGGLPTVSGAVTGATLVTLLQQFVRPLEDLSLRVGPLHLDRLTGLVQVCLVAVFFLVMYLRPIGIVGSLELSERLPPARGRLRPDHSLPHHRKDLP
jgi:branched-chain amino acid transport system permease protein